MKKIIYICYVPITPDLEKNFYIDKLLEAGIRVEFWDLSNIYFKHLKFDGVIKRDYVVCVDSLKGFKRLLDKDDNRDAIFFTMNPFNGMVLPLFRIMSKKRCTIVSLTRGLLPSAFSDSPLSLKIVTRYNKILNPSKVYNFGKNKLAMLLKRAGFIKYHDAMFCAGDITRKMHRAHSEVIPINHFDYDDYLLKRDEGQRLVKCEYAVFLDDNLIDHIDYKMYNIETPTPHKYYRSLNRFFDLIEKKHNIKVVIAAHPKSNYARDLFGKRDVYTCKTHELVKNCSFAIAHYSTSTSFAVLYKKPIVFTYTDEMRRFKAFNLINGLAANLNCSLYNIDSLDERDEIEIRPADLKKYDEYKYAYLTSRESENRLSGDVVLDYFKKCEVLK